MRSSLAISLLLLTALFCEGAAQTPISLLPAATNVTSTNIFPIVQNGVTKKATIGMVNDIITRSQVTNALQFTGSTNTFLRSDGTQAVPIGGGGSTNGANWIGSGAFDSMLPGTASALVLDITNGARFQNTVGPNIAMFDANKYLTNALSGDIQTALGPVFQPTNSNLTDLSAYGPTAWQGTNSTLTELSTNITTGAGRIVLESAVGGSSSVTSTFPITVTGGTNVGLDVTSDLVRQTNIFRQISKSAVRDIFTVPTRLVFDGDSLTSSNTAWVPYFTNLVSYPPNLVSNVAVSGQVIPALQSRYTNYVQPCKPAGGTNALLFVWAGINDIFYNTNTPTVIIANLSNYWTQARADGFDVVAFTITDRNNFPSQTNALERSYINSWIRRQGGVLWDYLVDVDSFMPAAYLGSESYYIAEGTNFVHFTAEGARMIAGAAFKTIFSPKNATALTPAEIMAPRYSGMTYFPDGTAALPSIGFSSQHNTGLYRSGNDIGVAVLGISSYGLITTDLRIGQGLPIGFSSGAPFSVGPDVFLMRDSAATLQMGKDALTPTSQTFKAPDATGTDHDGGSLTFEGGAGTGAARGGDIITKTSVSTNSSLVSQLYSTRHYESSRPSPMTNSVACPVINILVNTNHYLACKIFAATFVGNAGGDFQVLSEEFIISAVNKAGTVSSVVSTSWGSTLATSVGSTLTTTWTVVQNGSSVDVQNTPVSSLTPTTYYTKWTADVLSNDSALITPK